MHSRPSTLRTVSMWTGSPHVSHVLPILAAVIAPIFITMLDLSRGASSETISHRPFYLFGFFLSVVILWKGHVEFSRRFQGGVSAIVPLVLFLIVAYHFLILTVYHYTPSCDYGYYERAAERVITHQNLYENSDTGYKYPPLLAETLALALRCTRGALSLISVNDPGEGARLVVFYLYQCIQFLSILVAYVLCVKYVTNMDVDVSISSMLVALIFVCNSPLLNTLNYDQINVVILCTMLIPVMVARDRPWLAGLAIAVGAHIKIYPVLLILYLIMVRTYAPIFWFVLMFGLIFLSQVLFGLGLAHWDQFLGFGSRLFAESVRGEMSLGKLFENLMELLVRNGVVSSGTAALTTRIARSGAILAIVAAWYVWASARIERISRVTGAPANSWGNSEKRTRFAEYGHFTNTVALMLLASPLVWDHHYVMAIPIVLLAAVTQAGKKPLLVGLAALLICAIPPFDRFPLKFNPLIGLVILISLGPPVATIRKPLEAEQDSVRN